MTSKLSTLWLDEDQMQKMIRLVQAAKGKHSNIHTTVVEMTNLRT